MSRTEQIPVAISSVQAPQVALAERYAAVRRTTESLCEHLSPEDQMLQSMPEASPAKWHLAHTTWFHETFILKPHNPAYREFNPDFTFLFNSYYKQLGAHPNRGSRGLFSRPSQSEVLAYRKHVDGEILRLISRSDSSSEIRGLIELGLNHEQQHQELIVSDVKHAFRNQPLRPAFQPHAVSPPISQSVPRPAWFDYQGGIHEIGHCGDGFAFDNEGPRHRVYLRHFRLASRTVTNGEYLQFMADGGYRRPELWLSDGWDTCLANGWSSPLYWERDGVWFDFTCAGTRELNPAEPVCHVSYYEADAFARWAGARLASEFEWEIAAATLPITGNFLEDGRFHPVIAEADDSGVPEQMFGDVWEWTASPYVPYPGFRPVAGALGEYNGKFMCNQLVLRGGSCATPQSHIRATYRNFFPPQARWQFTGIRLANDRA